MLPQPDATLRIGQRVKKRYEILSVIGEGGQGSVYRARDRRDGDEVAIKVLNGKAADPAATERMHREASALVTLWGTCAVKVIDEGWTEDGSFAIVMELLVGEDLEAACKRHEQVGRHLPLSTVVSVFEPLVSTLEKAHAHGIVHRDLKPSNVFVLSDAVGGGVRLLDFGFAKFLRMSKLTSAGMIAGSPSYVAPETWGGQEADGRADVYALAAMMYRAVGGRPPFSGTIGELLQSVVTAPRPSLRALRPDLPEAIDDWALYGLAIERAERFQSVSALWNAFLGALGIA
ncbi:MAG: serine/threonine-protein kinase [Polyangiaceae bacterium]